MNPTATALLDRTPLLVVTGRQGLGSNLTHQRLSQVSFFEPVTKLSETASARTFGQQLYRALRVAMSERPGSVHLDMPADLPASESQAADLPPARLALGNAGPPEGIDEALKRLRAARRPLILAGNGAIRHGVSEGVQAAAEAWGMPVVTTSKAKGIISEGHPYWAGVLDMAAPRFMNDFVDQADLLLAVGFDPVELINPRVFHAPIVHLDVLPNLDGVYVSELELVGDMNAALMALASVEPGAPKWQEGAIRDHLASYLAYATQSSVGLSPSALIAAAREVLPDDSIVVSDVGSHKMALGSLWSTRQPRTFFQSNGLGTMGFSLPGAIAAKLLRPSVPVVAFCGDGGFAMVGSELGTAVDLRLPVIVVVFDDRSLDRIMRKQVQQGYPALGTTFGNPDFVKLAEAYGAAGYAVSTTQELQSSLYEALKLSDRPAVIAARIDPSEYKVQFEG